MKKVSVFIIALLIMCFVSCSDHSIDGKWITKQYVEEFDGEISLVYNFSKGEVFIESQSADKVPFSIPFGTYEISQNKLTITSDSEKQEYDFDVSEDSLKLTDSAGNVINFTKEK